jgi:hypothetical protein
MRMPSLLMTPSCQHDTIGLKGKDTIHTLFIEKAKQNQLFLVTWRRVWGQKPWRQGRRDRPGLTRRFFLGAREN